MLVHYKILTPRHMLNNAYSKKESKRNQMLLQMKERKRKEMNEKWDSKTNYHV